jgi:hypothetical protein
MPTSSYHYHTVNRNESDLSDDPDPPKQSLFTLTQVAWAIHAIAFVLYTTLLIFLIFGATRQQECSSSLTELEVLYCR